MADAERSDYHEDILPKKDSIFSMIRVATYINQIPAALDMVKDAHDKGYETTAQFDGRIDRARTRIERRPRIDGEFRDQGRLRRRQLRRALPRAGRFHDGEIHAVL